MTECTQPSTPSAPCPTGSSNPAAAPSVSRRGFLSGAAVAAGTAALAGLAGCAPKTQAEVAGETIAADDAATGGTMQTTGSGTAQGITLLADDRAHLAQGGKMQINRTAAQGTPAGRAQGHAPTAGQHPA